MPKTTKTNKPSNSDNNDLGKDITESSAEFEFAAVPPPAESSPDFGRRIKLLMAGIMFAVVAYSGAWFWFGSQLVKSTQTAISDAALKGQALTCESPVSTGYPFRMGLTCSKTGFADAAQGIKIEAGAFRSAAQVYEPRHIIGELDGPLQISAPQFQPVVINWSLAHASIAGNGNLPARVSIEVENPSVGAASDATFPIGNAKLAAFHMRQGDNNQIDLASNIEAAKLKDAPVFNLSADASVSGTTRFDAALESGKPLVDVLRGNQGELRSVKLIFSDGGDLMISGPFSLSEAGLLSGKFTIMAEKAGALIDNLNKLGVAFGVAANNLDAVKAMAINDKFNFTIEIKDGIASMGFIPLGKIPAF